MKNSHRPSRKQAVLFLLLSLALAALIMVWVFWINRGTLVVSLEPPFEISMGSKKTACPASPCRIALASSAYQVTISKAGYRPFSEMVKIRMRRDTVIAPVLSFIPVVRSVGRVTEKKLQTRKDGENSLYLMMEGERQWLVMKKDGKPKKIVSFERAFENPLLAQGNRAVLITDRQAEGNAYYLVDIEKATRERIFSGRRVDQARLIGDFLIFEEQGGRSLLNLETRVEKAVSAIDIENIVVLKNGSFVFFAEERKSESGQAGVGKSFEEALNEAGEVLDDEIGESSQLEGAIFLTRFQFETEKMETLAEILLKKVDSIHHLAEDFSGKKLTFENGEEAFEVLLEP